MTKVTKTEMTSAEQNRLNSQVNGAIAFANKQVADTFAMNAYAGTRTDISCFNADQGSYLPAADLSGSIYTSGGLTTPNSRALGQQYGYAYTGDMGIDLCTDVIASCRYTLDSIKGLQGNNGSMFNNGVGNNGAATTPEINTTNSAIVFDKLYDGKDDSKIKELAAKEKEIAKKEAEAKEEKDAAKQNELYKEVQKLKNDYLELEKKYCDGESLSKLFGKNFNFYQNLDKIELDQIQSANSDIKNMKADLERMQNQRIENWNKIQEKINEYAKAHNGANPPVDFISKAEKEANVASEKEIQAKCEEISKAIDNLSENIKKAGKSSETSTYFVTENSRREAAAGKAERDNEQKTSAKTIADGLFNENGTAKSADEITEVIKESTAGVEGFEHADKNDVASFLANQIKDKKKDDFLKDSKAIDEFLMAANNENNFIATGDENKDMRNDNLKMLMATFDALKDKQGSFESELETRALQNKGSYGKLQSAIKELKETEKAQAASSKNSSRVADKPLNDTQKAAQEKFDSFITANTKDGKIDWDAVKIAIDKELQDTSKNDEFKNKLRSLYNTQRTQTQVDKILKEAMPEDASKNINLNAYRVGIAAISSEGNTHTKSPEGQAIINNATKEIEKARALQLIRGNIATITASDKPSDVIADLLQKENISFNLDELTEMAKNGDLNELATQLKPASAPKPAEQAPTATGGTRRFYSHKEGHYI